ncbi:Signal recognition particle protein Ffh [hydrothermal vent metagenome]|uniref:signal-recognition-particle GTPase n=1 Tax=hydrothermal vent metagenome TaxID=652676 RepID=A0A3B1A285_9ZZZZ
MFDGLSDRLGQTVRNLRGIGRLSDDNIKDSLRDVRLALLEADVALPVVKKFIDDVKVKAVGDTVTKSLTPGQAFIKVVNDELVSLMGEKNDALNLASKPPVVILMAGLQGAGKTTTVAKLAKYLIEDQKKNVLMVSVDVYRPAAIEQLSILGKEINVDTFNSNAKQSPVAIAKKALKEAKIQNKDVVIIDTAGRLHIDDEMMSEIRELHAVCEPQETLFVVDSMTGQDAAVSAKAFNDALPLTGVVLTKTDGDARGGAALSIRQITGVPIKFMGVGEKVDALQAFYPDRVANRILGMGDIVSLVEDVQKNVDQDQALKLANKIKKGKGFDLGDFKDQLNQMRNMGGMAGLVDKLPGMSGKMAGMKEQVNDKQLVQLEAIINSMTLKERLFPDVIKGSRKRRIANGSGTQIQDVNRLLKQFKQMQKMMKKMSKGGMKNMMRGMAGRMPPGMMK